MMSEEYSCWRIKRKQNESTSRVVLGEYVSTSLKTTVSSPRLHRFSHMTKQLFFFKLKRFSLDW